MNHQLMINADYYTPIDEESIPTGAIEPVVNTPMEFREATRVSKRVNQNFWQLNNGVGYDHNYVFNTASNFLDGPIVGKDEKIYKKYYTICLESQHFHKSPNAPYFPSAILKLQKNIILLRFINLPLNKTVFSS
jgi:aldose 1-epimerase